MTVDGGTDRWLNYLHTFTDINVIKKNSEYLPKLIVGDLDSISLDVLEKFKKLDVQIVKTPNQNYTDYSKALMQVSAECKIHKIPVIKLFQQLN